MEGPKDIPHNDVPTLEQFSLPHYRSAFEDIYNEGTSQVFSTVYDTWEEIRPQIEATLKTGTQGEKDEENFAAIDENMGKLEDLVANLDEPHDYTETYDRSIYFKTKNQLNSLSLRIGEIRKGVVAKRKTSTGMEKESVEDEINRLTLIRGKLESISPLMDILREIRGLKDWFQDDDPKLISELTGSETPEEIWKLAEFILYGPQVKKFYPGIEGHRENLDAAITEEIDGILKKWFEDKIEFINEDYDGLPSEAKDDLGNFLEVKSDSEMLPSGIMGERLDRLLSDDIDDQLKRLRLKPEQLYLIGRARFKLLWNIREVLTQRNGVLDEEYFNKYPQD